MGDMAAYYIDQMTSGKRSVGSARRSYRDYQNKREEERTMNQEEMNIPTVIGGSVQVISTVAVRFLQGNTYKTYDFFTDENLLPDTLVVVDTSNGYSLARVEIMHKHISPSATKWVIDVVDTSRHEARIARERVEKELKRKMEKRRKELTEVEIYRTLAEKDEEMRELLTAYEQVQSGTAISIPQAGNRRAIIPPRRALVQEMHDSAVERAAERESQRPEWMDKEEDAPAWDNHGGANPRGGFGPHD